MHLIIPRLFFVCEIIFSLLLLVKTKLHKFIIKLFGFAEYGFFKPGAEIYFLMAAMLLFCCPAAKSQPLDEDIAAAKRIIEEIGASIHKKAVDEGKSGAAGGINFCRKVARSATRQMAEREGWTIKRASPKPRNPKNMCDDEESALFIKFMEAKSSNQTLDEYVAEGEGGFVYVRPIVAGEECLICHGASLSQETKEKILQFYPDDKALGYKAGDIMGIFYLKREDAKGK